MKKNLFFLLILLAGLGVLAFQGWQLYQSRRITADEHLEGQAFYDAYVKANESKAVPVSSFQAELLKIEGNLIYFRVADPAGDGRYISYSEDVLELSPDTKFFVLTGDSDTAGRAELFEIIIDNVLPGDDIMINIRADKERTEKPEIYSIYVLD